MRRTETGRILVAAREEINMAQVASAFDTLEVAQELKEAGIAERQAEAIARNIGKAAKDNEGIARIGEVTKHHATKKDLYHALWWQGLAIVTAITALLGGLMIALIDRLSSG